MIFDGLIDFLTGDEEKRINLGVCASVADLRRKLQDECTRLVNNMQDIDALSDLLETLREYFSEGGG